MSKLSQEAEFYSWIRIHAHPVEMINARIAEGWLVVSLAATGSGFLVVYDTTGEFDA